MKKRKIILPPPLGTSLPPADMGKTDTDPLGSWTGVPDNLNDTPVQDADDL